MILPLMVVVHAAHVWAFWLPEAERATRAARYAAWRDGLVTVHALTVVAIGLVLAALPLVSRVQPSLFRALPVLSGLIYLAHGAAIAGVDQLNAPNVSPYLAYSLALAALVALEPWMMAVLYPLGLAGFVVALLAMQPDPEILRSLLPNGPSVTVASVALAMFLHAGRKRDFAQRRTIEGQRRDLETLNASLEQRVQEQVGQIVARAEEVDRLNAQLHTQVRDRSAELDRALRRLGDRGAADDGLPDGTVLGGRFEIGGRLGAGAMGAVYRAVDRVTGSPVAVKVVHAQSAAQLGALRRFVREAGVAAAIHHPAVVRMIHVDISGDGTFFQAQELVVGETLRDVLTRTGAVALPVAVRLLEGLGGALAAAHAAGVVHRDVKPANLMLTASSPGLKLLDFGISKIALDDEQDATRSGMVVGTPAYMGPEQLEGRADLTDRTDLYAVGVLAFLLIAGRHPFPDTSVRGMARGHRRPPPDLRSEDPTVPAELAEAFVACLAPLPEDRPAAADLAARLRAWVDAVDRRPLEAWVREGAFVGPALAAPTSDPRD